MRVTILILTIFLLTTKQTGFAQNQELETLKGFRSIHFKSTITSFGNKIYEDTAGLTRTNMKTYVYNGYLLPLYNTDINDATLTFYKGKLFMIVLAFGEYFSDFKYDEIIYNLQLLYGFGSKGEETDITDDMRIIDGRIWRGKHRSIELSRFDHEVIKGQIAFIDYDIYNLIAKDGIND